MPQSAMAASTSSAPGRIGRPPGRSRFDQQRQRVIETAGPLISERGLKDVTLKEVASALGLRTTAVTYYFPRKELLAAAVFEATMNRLDAMVADAATAADPRERMARLIGLNIDLHAAVIGGTAQPLASLSDMRSLSERILAPLLKQYRDLLRRVRSLFGEPAGDLHKALLIARTHMLMEVIFWLPNWISQYPATDFPRVKVHLVTLLGAGIAVPGAPWEPWDIHRLNDDALVGADASQVAFLKVATRLVNETGYRGASVTRIVEEARVTKGSFYYHLDGKDDLILACFRQSYRRVALVHALIDAAGGTHAHRTMSAMATLLDMQFQADWPLLRTSALRALPPALRSDIVAQSNQLALRFAGMLVDGMCMGTVRPIDPMIASQLIVSTLNTAYELRKWAAGLPRAQAIGLYASTLVDGLFNDRVLDIDFGERA